MLKSYLTIALRTLRRHRGYTAINVLGLALGMTACLLIGLYVREEVSYDRFHEDARGLLVLGTSASVITAPALGPALADLPDVRHVVRTTQGGAGTPVTDVATGRRTEERVLLADAGFFEAFSFGLVRGDARAVLARPDGAVVTASAAARLFGDADPVGRTLEVERHDGVHTVTVTGVAYDVPPNSTVAFDVVAPFVLVDERYRALDTWYSRMYRTYVRLETPEAAGAFAERMRAAVAPHLREAADADAYFAIPLPELYLSDLHRADGFRGEARYLYIFGAVALFILLIAAINYINLVTALGVRRAKEVGVRKTMGAGRAQLARQFLGESVLVSAAALVVAAALSSLALPAFNRLFGTALTLDPAANGPALAALGLLVLGVGVAAGAYPAFVLTRFAPASALRGGASGRRGAGLRRGLVVAQFAITAVLLVGTLAVFGQLRYVQDKELGFAGEQVATVALPEAISAELRDALRQAVLAHPSVEAATIADALPGGFFVSFARGPEEWSPRARTDAESVSFRPSKADEGYGATLGLRLLAGRTFDRDRPGDRRGAYVLNRSGVEALGWTVEEAVGMPFALSDEQTGAVIGVVEDFHVASLHAAIAPVLLVGESEQFSSSGGVLAARLAPSSIRDGAAHLASVVARFAPGEPAEVRFLDDTFDAMYRSEERLGGIFSVFAGVAILIACLGLFGLASFVVQQRTKEIGVRKVLGASVPSIVVLLAREFLVLVGVALLVGAPVGFLLMDRWLDDFAYRITLGPGLFLTAAALAVAVALLAVSGQSLRAALADPVDALRYE